jgi:hypothetical protein
MQYPDGPVPGLPGMNAVDTRTRPPFTPWGKARFDAAKPMIGPRAVAGTENSPSLNCDPDGPPRVLLLPNPFEIVQIPGRVFMFFEEGHIWRTIWADGRPLPKDPDPSWLGYSVGHWEGDTFVVDTIGFNDKLWADPWGDPRSEKMHLTEAIGASTTTHWNYKSSLMIPRHTRRFGPALPSSTNSSLDGKSRSGSAFWKKTSPTTT